MARNVSKWTGCPAPGDVNLEGRFASVERLAPHHVTGLFKSIGGPQNDHLWQYIPIGPFDDSRALGSALQFSQEALGWHIYTICARENGAVLGMAGLMRVRPEHGSLEVGCIVFSDALKRTAIATEAMYLLARYVFEDLGYRRYEWKCNNENAASRKAAVRLGFEFEGVFRQDMVVKGKSRDTAWYSMLDREWPDLKGRFEAWLAPDNFDDNGKQKNSLGA